MKYKLSKSAIVKLSIVVVAVIGVVILLFHSGILVMDYSAVVHVEGMRWKGQDYSRTGGQYTEGRTIAKSKDGWNINEVEEDPSHTFVVVRSFLDQYLYVLDDYTVPTSGEITRVCWDGEYIEDKEFIKAMTEIDEAKTTSFDYETEAIFIVNDNQCMQPLYFAYEDCPIATVYKGYLGKINGKWVITTYISRDQKTASCYYIPDKYSQILEKYFFE